MHQRGVIFPDAAPCPVCGQPPSGTVPEAHPRLPTLLAAPLHELEVEHEPVLALWAACDAVEIALKLCVMLGAAPFEQLPEALRVALRDHVELPTLGRWIAMARVTARYCDVTPGVPLAQTFEALDALLGPVGARPDTGLLALRNRLAHGGPLGRPEAAALLSVWRPRVRDWVRSLSWLEGTTLVAVGGAGALELRGTVVGPWAGDVPPGARPGSVWLRCPSSRDDDAPRWLQLGPLSAFDVEDGSLRLYVRRGEVSLQYVRILSEGGLCESDSEALVAFRERFLRAVAPASDAASAPAPTVPGFESELRRESARRVGRERELERLRQLASNDASGLVWVSGAPGMGKSNLFAAWIEELLDAPPAGLLVLPYRFRAGDARCGRASFLAYLRERLLANGATEPPAPAPRRDAPHAPDDLDGVRRLLAALVRPGEAEPRSVLLAIDGADEIASLDPRFVPDVLIPLARAGARLFVFGRPEYDLPKTFAANSALAPFPDGLPPMDEGDVRALLLERTGPLRKRLLRCDVATADTVRNAFIDRVTTRSGGLPIYVNYVVGDMNAGRLHPEAPDALPSGLDAYHDELLRRAAVGDLQVIVTHALVLLALAYEPLSVATIAALLARGPSLSSPDVALVGEALLAIGALVRRAPVCDGSDDGFTVFHHSLRTHVLSSPHTRHAVAGLRGLLADAADAPGADAAAAYMYRCGVRHLLDAGREDEALLRQTDFPGLMDRFRCVDDAVGWYEDWDRVRDRGLRGGYALAWWAFARHVRAYFRRPGWEAWRVLFQAAMDYADDSPVTRAAESWEAAGNCDWAWMRLLNRLPSQPSSAIEATMSGHDGSVVGALLLGDGTALSWSDDRTLRRWSLADGRALAVLEGHRSPVKGAVRTADGYLLSWADDGELRTWDGASSAPLWTLTGHHARVRGVAQGPEGRVLSWSEDTTLRVWETTTGRCSAVLSAHHKRVLTGCWLTDGRVASVGEDWILHVWDLAAPAAATSVSGAALPMPVSSYSEGTFDVVPLRGGRFAQCSPDGTVRIREADGRCTATLATDHRGMFDLVELPDGRLMIAGDTRADVWELDTQIRSIVWPGDRLSLKVTRIGERALCASEEGDVDLWHLSTGERVSFKSGDGMRRPVVLPGCGGQPERVVTGGADRLLRVWDARTGALLASYSTPAPILGLRTGEGGELLSWSRNGLASWSLEAPSGAALDAPELLEMTRCGERALTDGRRAVWDEHEIGIVDDATGSVDTMSTELLQHTWDRHGHRPRPAPSTLDFATIDTRAQAPALCLDAPAYGYVAHRRDIVMFGTEGISALPRYYQLVPPRGSAAASGS